MPRKALAANNSSEEEKHLQITLIYKNKPSLQDCRYSYQLVQGERHWRSVCVCVCVFVCVQVSRGTGFSDGALANV